MSGLGNEPQRVRGSSLSGDFVHMWLIDLYWRGANVVETRIARPIKTALVPAEAATNPAAAGIRNWPSRLPVRRVETARARSSGAVN